ncbi:hypothetical protein [Luteipulveratus mongoliensis]|uniref:Uncharacterized protein n=1 Tax=Luteipulveratus mongoliensis TaxID=571913 RepID=A0A0K1JHW3_9MICO|nr:hypothetical protein [Luteipulveratus mongoliensis]AKU16286.1 hypothetical protein VV02_11125 [Luteipulveratus mongoliensis]
MWLGLGALVSVVGFILGHLMPTIAGILLALPGLLIFLLDRYSGGHPAPPLLSDEEEDDEDEDEYRDEDDEYGEYDDEDPTEEYFPRRR